MDAHAYGTMFPFSREEVLKMMLHRQSIGVAHSGFISSREYEGCGQFLWSDSLGH